MALFEYVALDRRGVEVKDAIDALSEKEAISKIHNLGYFPTKVRAKIGAVIKAKSAPRPKSRRGANAKVKAKYTTLFARQFSTLQDAGLTILKSLRILERQHKNAAFKRVIGYVADDIEGGSTLSEALGRYPRAFDRVFVNMVAAGEAGGVLDVILARVADFKEKTMRLKGRIKSAMIYPSVVLTAAFLILLGLMKYVIPQFETVLREMVRGDLNPVTVAVLRVSRWIAAQYGWAILLAVPISLILGLKLARRFRAGRAALDSAKLRLPVVGQLSGMVAMARWTRTLGTLISAGVPILDALKVTREISGNEVYGNLLAQVHNSIRQGDTFASALSQSTAIDDMVANMIAVGEETGDLDKMLLKIADTYDEQVDVRVGSMMSLLEPVLIVALGGVVMVIVLAVFLPIIDVILQMAGGGNM